MVIIKNLKNLLKKIINDFGRLFYKSFLKLISYVILILIIGLLAQSCAKAKTITNNLRTVSESNLLFLEDIYQRSEYRNFIIANDYYREDWGTVNDFYMCLTNKDLDTSNISSITSSCDKLYRYNSSSNNQSLELVNDNQLVLKNVIYYVSDNNKNLIDPVLFSILLLLATLFLFIVLKEIMVRKRSFKL